MTQLLAGASVFVCLVLIVYAIASQVEERSTVRASLRQLDDYQVENLRDKVLLQPFGARVMAPFKDAILNVGRRFWPTGYADNVRRKLIIAGKPSREDLDRFLSIRVLTIAALPVIAVICFGGFLPLEGKMPLAVFVLFGLAAVVGPDALLNRKMVDRQETIRRKL